VSITNTGGEGVTLDFSTDWIAECSLIGLMDHDRNLAAARRAIKSIFNNALASNCIGDIEALVKHIPCAIWRVDGTQWMGIRFLSVGTDGNYCVVTADRFKGKASIFKATESGLILVASSDLEQPTSGDYSVALTLHNFVYSSGIEKIGVHKSARLWNGRIYDSMEMMAKIRQLLDTNVISIDSVVDLETRPLLSPTDALGKYSNLVAYPPEKLDWEAKICPTHAYVRTLFYPHQHWSCFIPEMKATARNIVASKKACLEMEFKMFISFDLEKRKFQNQVEILALAIDSAKIDGLNICIYINGMTGPDGGADSPFYEDIRQEEIDLISDITERCGSFKYIHMFGWSLRRKLMHVSQCSLFIAPSGNASLIPMLLDIPGVFYASPAALKQLGVFSHFSDRSALIGEEHVRSLPKDLAMRKVSFGWDDGTRISYVMEPRGFLKTFDPVLRAATKNFLGGINK
jgi:hypothetical protein